MLSVTEHTPSIRFTLYDTFSLAAIDYVTHTDGNDDSSAHCYTLDTHLCKGMRET